MTWLRFPLVSYLRRDPRARRGKRGSAQSERELASTPGGDGEARDLVTQDRRGSGRDQRPPGGRRWIVGPRRRRPRSTPVVLRPRHSRADERVRCARDASVWAVSCPRQGDQESDLAPDHHHGPGQTRCAKGVTTFHFHMHLPHDALTTDDATSIHVLARQPIDLSRRIRSRRRGTGSSMRCIHAPKGTRGGHTLMADSTVCTTVCGGTGCNAHAMALRKRHGKRLWNYCRKQPRSPC